MKPSEKSKLIGKFWEGNTTHQEEEELFSEITSEGSTNHDEDYFRYIAEARMVGDNRQDEIWKSIVAREHRKKRIVYLSSGIAASFLLLVSLFMLTQAAFESRNFKNQLVSTNLMDYYKAYGIEIGSNPTLYINGCKLASENSSLLQNISPKCIQHISATNGPMESGKHGNKSNTVEVWLKGKSDEIYSICEGTLYFYQDGEIKTITIDDECSPNLLVDCLEIPLSEIKEMKPQLIKSIELTTNPRNCNGPLSGEFIVLESK